MTPDQYLSELLQAIERHTQATQANTAAVNSLLGRKGAEPAQVIDSTGRLIVGGQLEALREDIETVHKALGVLTDRLELLRQSLSIDQPTPPEAPHAHPRPTIIPAV